MNNKSKKIQTGTAEWEAICRRCGRCCYEKLDYRGKIFYTNTPCPHLDTENNSCRIYQERAELHPDCVQLTTELVAAGILPDDCPYVAGLVDYPAPKKNS